MKRRTLSLQQLIFDNLVGAPDNSFVIGASGRQYGRFLDQESMSAVSQTFFAIEVGELALSGPAALVVGTSSRFSEGFDPGSE